MRGVEVCQRGSVWRWVAAATVMATVAVGVPAVGASADVPVERRDTGRVATSLAAAAETLAGQRTEPVRERSTVRTTSAEVLTIQDYHDTCGDSSVGDLLSLGNTDIGSLIGWDWAMCEERGFAGTADDLLLMYVYDLDLPYGDEPDYAIAQWPQDGYFEVYYAGRSPWMDDWLLLEDGFGDVYERGGRIAAGGFIFDADGARFPTAYEFAVSTGSAGQVDVLPKPGHPLPTWPTRCTTYAEYRAELVLDPAADPAQVQRDLVNAGAVVQDLSTVPHGIMLLDRVDDDTLARVAAVDGVRSVQRPWTLEQAQLPDQWHLQQLGIDPGWANLPALPSQVAVIDSGVDVFHPSLQGAVGAGFDAIAGQIVPAGRSTNMGYHGTGVASMVAGNGTAGVYGVNPEATIRPVLVSSHDGCLTSDRVTAGVLAAAEMPDVTVINISVGGPPSFAEEAAIQAALDRGKLVVAASGNDQEFAPGVPNFPASLSSVIGVGATSISGAPAVFSQTAGAEILAPGEELLVATGQAPAGPRDGTSFAAPLVAGALASWAATNPGATLQQARDAMTAASTPVEGSTAPLLDIAVLLAALSEPEPGDFTDVAGTTHEVGIKAVAAAGITGGYPDGTYRPSNPVTRGQMATFLTRALSLGAAESTELTDVAGTTHEVGIKAVAAVGITGGYPDGTYRPSNPVTRGQMATFLTRALNLET